MLFSLNSWSCRPSPPLLLMLDWTFIPSRGRRLSLCGWLLLINRRPSSSVTLSASFGCCWSCWHCNKSLNSSWRLLTVGFVELNCWVNFSTTKVTDRLYNDTKYLYVSTNKQKSLKCSSLSLNKMWLYTSPWQLLYIGLLDRYLSLIFRPTTPPTGS